MRKIKIDKKLSQDFIEKIASIYAGYLPPDSFEKFIELLENEVANRYFTFSSESNLLRIILGMFDKISFLNDSIKYPHYIEILAAIALNSNYLSDILVRNPEFFYSIINPSKLKEELEEKAFTISVKESLHSFKTFPAKLNAIRSLKRKEILKIGVKDIFGMEELKKITEQLSILARVISSELFSLCYSEILSKHNLKKVKSKYCIVSLGKLGGNELNYSSDIDLIIFYDKNSKAGNKEYYEILTEAVYLFIESATAVTSSGYIYRVDFRLRPDGRTSPLCRSLTDYLIYYESRGEDWERQMLIKSNFAAGEKKLYEKFKKYLTPFIYPSSFGVSPIEQIKRLKLNIEKNLKEEENIKLSSGGIRDIEFSVQALQLLNGGKLPELRTGGTMEAIEKLKEKILLSEEEANTLNSSYIFYRKIEHYLQLMNDRQTHTIPSEGEMLEKLSSYLGFKSSAQFKEAAAENRKKVIKIYNSIFEAGAEEKNKNKITEIKFADKDRADKDIRYLREGKGLLGQKEFDKKSTAAFHKIEAELFNYLKRSFNPDKVLQNFVRVFKTVLFPSLWYKEFIDKKFFISFLHLCEYSQKTIDLFAEDEELREYFLTRKVFLKIIKNDLKEFSTKNIMFLLSAQFSLKLIDQNKVSKILTDFFSRKIYDFSESSLNIKTDYFIASMGSFGTGEMTFTSDIDLIFVVNNIESDHDIQKKFQALLLKFKDEFKPFDVDCRLRPEGKSSPLVWDLGSYKSYIENRARTWELQAFCKLNFLYGSKKIFNSFTTFIQKRIKQEEKEQLRKDIAEMRRKLYPQDLSSSIKLLNLKKNPGGLTDIEFIIQFLILSNSQLFSKCRGKNTLRTISILIAAYKELADLEKLKENFTFLKNIELSNQIIFNSSASLLPIEDIKMEIIAHFNGYNSSRKLQDKLNNILKINASLFEKYLTEN